MKSAHSLVTSFLCALVIGTVAGLIAIFPMCVIGAYMFPAHRYEGHVGMPMGAYLFASFTSVLIGIIAFIMAWTKLFKRFERKDPSHLTLKD